MEYHEVSKSVLKVIKQLLDYSSSDSYRDDLFQTVNVDLEKGIIGSADGFKLIFVKMTNDLKEIFKESGTFKIQTGTINYKPVITLERHEGHYPNLLSIMTSGERLIKFGINPSLLIDALKYADKNQPVEFIIYKYENMKLEEGLTTPIEMRFGVADCDVNAIIMPMHISESKKWGVKE